jgi:hypothetical protein
MLLQSREEINDANVLLLVAAKANVGDRKFKVVANKVG